MFDKIKLWIQENKTTATVIGIVAFLLLCFVSYEGLHFSSSPPFCRAVCHFQAPDVDNWEASAHGRRGVDCVSCHFKEGPINYMMAKMGAMTSLVHRVTGAMGHHPSFLEETTAELQNDKKYRGIELTMLPQYIHSPDDTANYVSSSNADDDGVWVIITPRGSDLRININKNCETCHSSIGNRGRQSKFRTADFIVRNQLIDFTGKAERRRKGIIVPHAIHLDKGYNCLDCHAEIVHAPQEFMDEHGAVRPRMDICFQCHNDRLAPRDCTVCHQLQLRMNLGIEGMGVADTPNYMYPDSTVCVDCHLTEDDYKIEPVKICADECHEEGYEDTFTEWKDQTMALMNKIEPEIKAIGRDIRSAKAAGRNVGPAEELYNDANYNFRYVKDDGSKGNHNVDYAEALLGVALEKASMARDLLGQ